MKTKLATAFGLAMLSVAFSFSTSFACPETSQTAASAVESTISESRMNVTTAAEVSAPEGQVGEVVAPASVVGNIEAPSADAAAPSIAFADAIRVEITETATVVVPGQNSEDDEGAAVPGQKSEDIDEVEITGSEPEHPIAAPNLNRDKATADDNGG